MANDCYYEMKIKGSENSILRVLACLTTGYAYNEHKKPLHKHFFRIFDADTDGKMEDNGDGTFTAFIYGYCAWSVWSCMCSGNSTYYDSVKRSYPNIFMGTTLLEQSKDCEIEVFSEEEGMGFSEHYIFKNGECLCETTEQIKNAGYNDKGKITTHIDWDTYDGDYVVINPNREEPNGIFRWTI